MPRIDHSKSVDTGAVKSVSSLSIAGLDAKQEKEYNDLITEINKNLNRGTVSDFPLTRAEFNHDMIKGINMINHVLIDMRKNLLLRFLFGKKIQIIDEALTLYIRPAMTTDHL